MQQMQYNVPNRMYDFKHFSGDDTPGPPFGAGTQNRALSSPKFWLRASFSVGPSSSALKAIVNRSAIFSTGDERMLHS